MVDKMSMIFWKIQVYFSQFSVEITFEHTFKG